MYNMLFKLILSAVTFYFLNKLNSMFLFNKISSYMYNSSVKYDESVIHLHPHPESITANLIKQNKKHK